ncbi:hypothetical protein ACEP28_12075, partial [Pseudomonas aeruginosa]
RGISGRMRVEWVAGSPWNRWPDAHGMGGQMTVESAALEQGVVQGHGWAFQGGTENDINSGQGAEK